MMTRGGEGGKKCPKFDDVICERPLTLIKRGVVFQYCSCPVHDTEDDRSLNMVAAKFDWD